MRANPILLVVTFFGLLELVACGGHAGDASICTQQSLASDPNCQITCDPQPGAPNLCPGGYHCGPDSTCDAACNAANSCGDGYLCTADGYCVDNTAIVDCVAQGKPPTTITGKIFAPNGTLPLFGIDVYSPGLPIAPFLPGAQCTRCTSGLPGAALAQTQSTEDGTFALTNAPSGDNVKIVVATGKWRRQYTIPHVDDCKETPLPPEVTRLPKDTNEGELPRIALSTGNADALECLLHKLGIADKEFTTDVQGGRINLFTDGGAGADAGTSSFTPGYSGGSGPFSDSTALWNTVDGLKPYDIVVLSCEGAQDPQTKSQDAMGAMKAYADLGGRVFLSHWHNIWIEGSTEDPAMTQAPDVWPAIGTFNNSSTTLDNGSLDTIDEMANPKGASFAQWMLNVGGSTQQDLIPIGDQTGKNTCTMVDPAKAERWVYLDGTHTGGVTGVQNFQFTTPNENPLATRCGKVVFSDMHVSGDSISDPTMPFPSGCAMGDLTPQEKALAFMFFDISSCVGAIL